MAIARVVLMPAVAAVLLTVTVWGGEPPGPRPAPDDATPIGRVYVTPEEIQEYVCREGITTVEDFLDRVDPLIRSNYTLMDNSRSRQQPSTLDGPRIIMFRPDGRLFLGVATNLGSNAYLDVEILALDDDLQPHAKSLTFDRRRFPRPTLLDGVPGEEARCDTCHGPSLRPIWFSYSEWPGAYAPIAQLEADEAATLTRLLAEDNPDENPRLRKLVFVRNVWTNRNNLSLPNRKGARPANESLNEVIGGPHLERLWRQVRDVEKADLFLVDALFQVDSGLAIPDPELRRQLDARIDREWQARGMPQQFPKAERDDRPFLLLGLDASRDLELGEPYRGEASSKDQEGLAEKWTYIGINIGQMLALRFVNESDELRGLRRLMPDSPYVTASPCGVLNQVGYRTLDDYRTRTTSFLWEIGLDEKVRRLREEVPPTVDLRFNCLFTYDFVNRPEVVDELNRLVRRTLERYP